MPRKPIDYNKNIIYKLVCNDLTVKDLYVGHTTAFTNRKRNHKTRCLIPTNSKHNLKVYKMIRENGSWDNWSMIEIEKFACKDENEARARERHWYEELQATMNSLCPILYAGEKNQYKKDYYIQNKDYHHEKHKCGCGGCFTTQNKSIHFKTKKHLKYIQENESK
jgi:hypothetical protein